MLQGYDDAVPLPQLHYAVPFVKVGSRCGIWHTHTTHLKLGHRSQSLTGSYVFFKLATRLFDLEVSLPRPGDPAISDAIGTISTILVISWWVCSCLFITPFAKYRNTRSYSTVIWSCGVFSPLATDVWPLILHYRMSSGTEFEPYAMRGVIPSA